LNAASAQVYTECVIVLVALGVALAFWSFLLESDQYIPGSSLFGVVAFELHTPIWPTLRATLQGSILRPYGSPMNVS
jgi:predicted membrane protein